MSTSSHPNIPSLTFRHFRGEADYPHIVRIIEGSKQADGVERSITLDDVRRDYEHLVNCDPFQDLWFAEVDGQPVAYVRVHWRKQDDGIRIYSVTEFVLPEWRRQGIGSELLRRGEARLREIAAGHPEEDPKFFQTWAQTSEKDKIALLEQHGYRPIRHNFEMTRDLSEPFPEAPLPPGLEVRPVEAAQIPKIIAASEEAFRDHWGFTPVTPQELEAWMQSPRFQPHLWKIAWDGDQVAGIVLNFINEEENREYNRKRGYTEEISVGRPWRGRGLAKSLIVQSMKMFKEMGFTETALGVDAENPTGALHLYKKLGYKVIFEDVIYRKPLEEGA